MRPGKACSFDEGCESRYRNHKLTLLMSDSLGGKSKSLMFVNIAGGNMHVAETLSSLGYAARVKEVSAVLEGLRSNNFDDSFQFDRN